MSLMPVSFLVVCPMLFLAGFVDAIGGGGGLISLPAYLFAGLPIHQAIATNKLSSSCGTALSTARFLKNGLVNLKLVLPALAAAFAGSFLGARLSLTVSEDVMKLYPAYRVACYGLCGTEPASVRRRRRGSEGGPPDGYRLHSVSPGNRCV